jgi:hypothetical protein
MNREEAREAGEEALKSLNGAAQLHFGNFIPVRIKGMIK